MLVAITAGIITVKPNSLLVPFTNHVDTDYAQKKQCDIFRNRFNILANCSASDISECRHKRLESAKIYSCFLVFKPLQTETAKASIDNPTATSNRSSSPIGIPSFTGLSLCPIYNPFLCFFLLLNHFIVMAFFRKQFRMGSHFFNASLI